MRYLAALLLLVTLGCEELPKKNWLIEVKNPAGQVVEAREISSSRAWTSYNDKASVVYYDRNYLRYPPGYFIKITEKVEAKAEVDTL